MPELSIFDERLAEIDRRLRVIQTGLVPAEMEAVGAAVDVPVAPAVDVPVASALRRRSEPPRPAPPMPPPLLHAAPPAPGLDPEPAPEPGSGPGRPSVPPRLRSPVDPADRLAELAAAHERLLELHRELLSQYAEVLERRAGESATLAVTAGPFSTAAAFRDFERALAALPGVSGVVVREYPGEDRVRLDVRLTSA